MSNIPAVRVVQKFRYAQLKGLESHIRRFGPLSTGTNPTASAGRALPNPFIARKSPSGRWIPPAYSLRKQAELVKAAKASGLLHLLPPGPQTPSPPSALENDVKASNETRRVVFQTEIKVKQTLKDQGEKSMRWLRPVTWEGKVKEKACGAELGVRLYAGKKRMFKGHKWERVQQDRKTRQAILLRDMKKRIFNYKNFYKRRKPDPLKPPRTLKSPKLPF